MSESTIHSKVKDILSYIGALALVLIAASMVTNLIYNIQAGNEESDILLSGKKRKKSSRVIWGLGYVRGEQAYDLRNKYSGYVSKVNFVSQQKVKKNDVLLEYDDLEIREKITQKQDEILRQKEELAMKKVNLRLKLLDPLPSDYRNLQLKIDSAKALYERLQHEELIYANLHKIHSVSDLTLREKQQETRTAASVFRQYQEDAKLLKHGLTNLYIDLAVHEVRIAELTLADLEHDLVLLKEELKYYSIVAPHDGICVMNSDTLMQYDTEGTVAASVHAGSEKWVYAYFSESTLPQLNEKSKGIFRSNQYAGKEAIFPVSVFQVDKTRTTWGDELYFLVKFRIDKEHKPLRYESVGRIEITVEN